MIRQASERDIEEIAAIYDEILTEIEAGRMAIGWERGVYPTEKTASEGAAAGDMFVAEENGKILASARINHHQLKQYGLVKWEYEAPDDKVMVLHTLTVSPKAAGQGLGSEFVRFYEQYAKEKGCDCLRLDTNVINLAARRFYKKQGYREAGTAAGEFNGIEGVTLVLLEKKL